MGRNIDLITSRAAKKLAVSTLEMVNDEINTEGLEKKAVLPVSPKSKVYTTFNFAGPINSEHNK